MSKETVSLEQIRKARERISQSTSPTPVLKSLFLSNRHAKPVSLKLENLNVSGSFKIRGAANALMAASKSDLKSGVIAASAGNHAQAVAWMCQSFGLEATIVMPTGTPLIKVESTKALGANVILTGRLYDDAFAEALTLQKRLRSYLLHGFADPQVINGQGTIGLELLQQVRNLGTVVVPIGGGGLISGIAVAIKESDPSVKVIGVQARAYSAMKQSIDAGKVVQPVPEPTIADGIAIKGIQEINFQLVQKYVDDIVLVEDESIAAAIMDLMERNHLLAEGAGAASIAALGQLDKTQFTRGKETVCIVSGGNIDVNLLKRIADRGMISSGRLMRIRIRVMDSPGQLAEVLRMASKIGANLLEVQHNRVFAASHFSEVEIDIDFETANEQQQRAIRNTLQENNIRFWVLNSKGEALVPS